VPSFLQEFLRGFFTTEGQANSRSHSHHFQLLLGSDRNFDTNNNDRPVGVGRNTGRGFDFASLDLRLSRKFRLGESAEVQLIGEGFNMLNRSNLSVPNNTFGTGVTPLPTFRQATAAFDSRQFQFGVKLTF